MTIKSILPKLALLTATVIWGSAFFIMKQTLDDIPPSYLLMFRFCGAALILAVVFFKKLRLINRFYLYRGAVMGFLMFIGYYTQTLGLTTTTPGKNAFLTAVYCVIVPFLSWITAKPSFKKSRRADGDDASCSVMSTEPEDSESPEEKPDRYNFIAAIICITGIGFVSLTDGFSIELGDALTLICGFFYAAHIIVATRYSQGRDIFVLTIIQFAVTGLLSLIVALFTEEFPRYIPSGSIISLVYLCVASTAIALLLQNIGQKYTPPSSSAIILSLEAVFGVIFSMIFYKEAITSRLAIGFALIFVAIIVSETKLGFLKRRSTL